MPTLGFPIGDTLAPDATGNRLETLLAILLRPVQRLENAMIEMLTLRSVDAAVGVQLDVLGKLVGQGRGGLVDDDYRRYIRARIATNRSTGKREELIRIARLIVNDPAAKVYIARQGTATVFIRIDGVACPTSVEVALISFLGEAAALGVRVIVQTGQVAPSLRFKFSGGTPAGLGFDNTIAPGSGGKLDDVREAI